ncbi:NAD(P)-dependent oxidoreductase [Sphingomonas naphthae]|uniref:NAD(P)-dependent oxidoreductase n=1 Tax=Sphingomonas naphthae TaxID=1813468 RepID=A0ABY7TPH6_9SPHN|nr:NAD(P)-dependent oxidoreductase [Sphingomonas naphthae]WCT75125.1 NAD(P)-dependent oxidoreductase [Sphingomonas naphthae]
MRVGFIGLGFQGKPLARNIVEAGYPLTVYDVRPEPMTELAGAGATAAATPAEVAAASDLVILCVVNDAQVLDVLGGEGGVFPCDCSGKIVVIHSTVLPDTIAAAADLAGRHGAVLVDAPVSGSAKGAEEKTMAYMVGGDEAAVAACLPVFRTSGQSITLTGAVGTATAAKIAHQLVCCVNMIAVSEGLRLGEAAGVSREALLAVFSAGFAQSRAGDMWPELDLHPRATPIFYKDLKAAITLGHDVGVAIPAAALTQQMLPDILPRIGGAA